MNASDIHFTILAAGKSSRNYPHSKGLPHKSLLPFGSKKIIDYILSEIIAAGGKSISLIVSDQSAIDAFEENFVREKGVEEKFKKSGNHIALEMLTSIYLPADVKVDYIIQDAPKGLGHAISLAAAAAPSKHLGVILPDDLVLATSGDPIIKRVVDQYMRDGGVGNLFLTREVEDVTRWGIIEQGRFKEKPAVSLSKESSIMFFILDQKVAQFIHAQMDEAEKNFDKNLLEIHYSEFLNQMIDQDFEAMQIRTVPLQNDDLYLDCGTIAGYEQSLLYSLLKLSQFKENNLEYVRQLI